MASAVDICNLALAHLGDVATVASIDPPEGSAQAEHCQRFYPIARDSLLEMHSWGFSTKRATLALLGSNWPEWRYAYACPNDMLNVLAVLDKEAADDYSVPIPQPYSNIATVNAGQGFYTPQPFSVEALDTGAQVIYTNVENATLRYTARVTDTTRFSPLFVEALSWLLASKLAGPILKGDAGAAMSQNCMRMFLSVYGRATASDSNQRRTNIQQSVGWMANR
jgi:hypothetical protein